MAAQRTQLNLGAIAVEISLAKVSGEEGAAKWETRLVDAETGHVVPSKPTAPTPAEPVLLAAVDEIQPDPLGAAPLPDPHNLTPVIPQTPEQAKARDQMATRGQEAASTRTERGVTREDGTWADLTEHLAAIDEHVKLDGMQVLAAIPAQTIRRERVRGASYVVPADQTATKALALLFDALSGGPGEARHALAVRWTKRTNQALGIIVPSAEHGALVLLEVEFAAAMREAPAKAKVATTALTTTDAERSAAGKYIAALHARTSTLDELVDERRALHAALLRAAKAGQTFTLPQADVLDEGVTEALAAAVS